MKAAIIEKAGEAPHMADLAEPQASKGETVVTVTVVPITPSPSSSLRNALRGR